VKRRGPVPIAGPAGLAAGLAALATIAASTPVRGDAVPDCPAALVDLDGVATYYAADGSGACTFPASADRMVVALAAPNWAGSAHCGRCLEVWGPEGRIVVRVVDLCPECPSGHLDLSAEAFDRIADPPQGIVPVAFRSIECPVTGNLRLYLAEGSSVWWVGLQVRNHPYAVSTVEFRQGGIWYAGVRQPWNSFQLPAAFPEPIVLPLQIRITDVHGRSVQTSLASIGSDVEVPTAVQLPLCDGLFVDGFGTGTATPFWSRTGP
jgi:expansin (peptidoglycan-binding protein)